MQNNQLFVGNLSYDWAIDDLEGALREIFSSYGQVVKVYLPRHLDSGKHKGFAFVTMQDGTAASAAKRNLENQLFGPNNHDSSSARPLHIDFARPREHQRS